MARTRRTKRPRFSQTCSGSSRVPLTSSTSSADSELNSYSSDSDSSTDSVAVNTLGVVDDTGSPVVTAVEVVEAQPVKLEDLSGTEACEEADEALIRKWRVQARIAEGKALVKKLEQELLSGLSGALVHKKDPFGKLRTAFRLTDLSYGYGLDQGLDYRIDRIRELKKIAQQYEELGSVRLWRPIDLTTDEE